MDCKPGWKSTEFWESALVALAGFAFAIGVISPEQIGILNEAIPQSMELITDVICRVSGLAAMLGGAFGYSKHRSEVKRGLK